MLAHGAVLGILLISNPFGSGGNLVTICSISGEPLGLSLYTPARKPPLKIASFSLNSEVAAEATGTVFGAILERSKPVRK